jgi:hypothetical protein
MNADLETLINEPLGNVSDAASAVMAAGFDMDDTDLQESGSSSPGQYLRSPDGLFYCQYPGCQHEGYSLQSRLTYVSCAVFPTIDPLPCHNLATSDLVTKYDSSLCLTGLCRKHMDTHYKPWFCSHCPVAMANLCDINKHIETHKPAGARDKFSCLECEPEKKFARKDVRLKHMRRFHPELFDV